ncbi:MAG: protein-L-isoaspartate(D-aspartate) O-methyltransferase [Halobacteria archaeon]
MAKKDDRDVGQRRNDLVEKLVERGSIESDKVERAIRTVEREEFVPPGVRSSAYADRPLRIGEGQTISAPHMVAIMLEELDLEEGQEVLEIGTGRGYHAALTAEIVGGSNVYTVERHEELAVKAMRNLEKQGYQGVHVEVGDGSLGMEEYAPYDRIYVTCAAPEVPDPLADQLKVGGRMVVPVGRGRQSLYKIDKTEEGLEKTSGIAVRFVKMLGEEGF